MFEVWKDGHVQQVALSIFSHLALFNSSQLVEMS